MTTGSNWAAEMDAKAREAANHLLGSCESLDAHYEDFSDDATFCAVLDSLVFECTGCGWWCEIGECNDHPESGEWVCVECYGEATEETDD